MRRLYFYAGLALGLATRKILPRVGEGQVIPKGLSYALSKSLRLYVHVGERMWRVRISPAWPWVGVRRI